MTKEEIKFIEQMFYAKRNGTHVSEGDIYELEQDGKTSNYGRASAVYFTPDQVEPNKPKEIK